MALLERVATLVRANLNDPLIDKTEELEKMIKQVILDMQNQLLQSVHVFANCVCFAIITASTNTREAPHPADWLNRFG
jgi:phage shock protein A